MRRKDREVTGKLALRAIIDRCPVARLAMVNEGKPYVVPMNYGYTWDGERPVFYFHCSKAGMKLDILSRNPNVAIEMDGAHELVEADIACRYGFGFESVIAEGEAVILEEEAEKIHALDIIMRRQTGKDGFEYSPPFLGIIKCIRVDVIAITGKRRIVKKPTDS